MSKQSKLPPGWDQDRVKRVLDHYESLSEEEAVAEDEAALDGPAEIDADRAWLEEVQRRSAEFDAGLVEVIPAEEVFERVRARLKR